MKRAHGHHPADMVTASVLSLGGRSTADRIVNRSPLTGAVPKGHGHLLAAPGTTTSVGIIGLLFLLSRC